jgi:hypothetical protein
VGFEQAVFIMSNSLSCSSSTLSPSIAREKTREQAEETEGTQKPKRTRWSEAETKMLIQLEVELQGSKQINVAIAGILESKTAKQISYKRSMLSKAKQPKGQTPPLDAEPLRKASLLCKGFVTLLTLECEGCDFCLFLNEVGLFSFLRCKVVKWIEDFYWVVYGSLLCVLCPWTSLVKRKMKTKR